MDKYLMDITLDEPERQQIRIDGEVYDIAVLDDFGPEGFLWITSAGKKIGKLFDQDYSEEGAEELATLLDETVSRLIPKLRPETLAKIPTLKKFRMIMFFAEIMDPEINATDLWAPLEKFSPGPSSSMAKTPTNS